MTVFSIIKKSQLESAHRLDAEYYQQEYLSARAKLRSSPILDDISKKITDFGAYSQMNFVEYKETGVRFFRNQDIGEFFIENNDPVFISNETYEKLSLKLREYDIVTPRVGTLGNAAVVFKENLPASANQNLAQIKPDTGKIDPLYLATFLSSKFGRFQFDQFATGNVQPWLNLSQIKSIKIFLPSLETQRSIAKFALEALREKEKSIHLYSQAEDLLLEELGLNDFRAEEDPEGKQASYGAGLSYVVNLSDIKSAHRIDAEYFQPKYKELEARIKKNESRKLSEIVSIKKGFEPGSEAYQEEGKLFLRVSSLSKNGIEEKDQKYLSDTLYQKLKKDFEPKVGEILLTKDATPGIAYVVKEPIGGIISGGILRLNLKEDIGAEYLSLCINSIVGQMQAARDAGGSIIAHWRPEQIKNILIPILPQSTQQKIAELVRGSHAARREAKKLLEQAKQKVEDLIENKL